MKKHIVLFLFYCVALSAADIQEVKSASSSYVPVISGTRSTAPTPAGERGTMYTVPRTPVGSLHYEDSPEGIRFTAVRFRAVGAAGVRLHFQNFSLPSNSAVYVYNSTPNGTVSNVLGPFRGSGPGRSGDFWTQGLRGDTVSVEFQTTGDIPADLPFALAEFAALQQLPSQPVSEEAETVHTGSTIYRGTKVHFEVINGLAITQGDIVLGPANTLPPGSSSEKTTEKGSVAVSGQDFRWPGGVVPYVIESNVTSTAIAPAIAHWNTKLAGVINMIPRTTESDYVRFVAYAGSTCASYVGRVSGGQAVYVGPSCSTGNLIHELGHAVGLQHEQSREDRDTWVTINYANVTSSAIFNFAQVNNTSEDIRYYAYNSVMHYPPTGFSSNGKPTILTRPEGIPIGQRTGLDICDIAAVRTMYNATDAPVDISSVPTGKAMYLDGVSASTPAAKTWVPGTVHAIYAPSPILSGTTGSQYDFVRWTDGGAQTHWITIPSNGLTVAAVYSLNHKLTMNAPPAGTGTVSRWYTVSDPPPGTTLQTLAPVMMHAQGSSVTLVATPAPDYCFSSWTGLTAGTAAESTLTMGASYNVTANFIVGAITPGDSQVNILKKAATYSLPVAASTGCGFMVSEDATWITLSKTYLTSAAPNVSYTVSANTTGTPRSATILINGTPVVITQGII